MENQRPWSFCSHETDLKKLEQILMQQYGVLAQLPEKPSGDEDSIHDLAVTAVYCCMRNLHKLGMDRDTSAREDEDSFGRFGAISFLDFYDWEELIRKKAEKADELDYLVLDALFHVCQEEMQGKMESFHALCETMKDRLDDDNIDLSNKNKLLKKHVIGSAMERILGISTIRKEKKAGGKDDCEDECEGEAEGKDEPEDEETEGKSKKTSRVTYQIPVFMDVVIYHLIEKIKRNPYRNVDKRLTYSSLKRFFEEDYLDGYGREYFTLEKDEDEILLGYYLLDRLFDMDAMAYFADFLSRREFLISPKEHLRLLVPIIFVPDQFCKSKFFDEMSLKYLDYMAIKKKRNKERNKNTAELVEREDKLRISVGKEIAHLGKVYYPLLTACFYYLFRTAYPSLPEAHGALRRYIKDRNLLEKYKEKKVKGWEILENLNKEGKTLFVEAYTLLCDIVCNQEVWQEWIDAIQVDYMSTYRYQEEITKTVLKEKMQL